MTQHTHANGPWPGTWLVNCDVCGINISSDQIRKRWDGLLVCKKDWEEDHPQKYIRVGPDPVAVPIIRPESTDGTGDAFVPQCTLFGNQAVAGAAVAGCSVNSTWRLVDSGGSLLSPPPPQGDLYWNNVVFLLPPIAPNPLQDYSQYNHVFNASAGTMLNPSDTNALTGSAIGPMQLAGSPVWAAFRDNAIFNNPTQNLTLEFRIKINSFIFTNTSLVSIWGGASGTAIDVQLWNDGDITYFLRTPFGDTEVRINSNLSVGFWYSLCIERFGSTFTFYINGLPVANSTITDPLRNPMTNLTVGAQDLGNNGGADTIIDQLRYTINTARYSGLSYTPETTPFPTF